MRANARGQRVLELGAPEGEPRAASSFRPIRRYKTGKLAMGNTACAEADAGAAPLVLVIDDDPDALSICELALRASGYRTATAASGEAGLACLDTLRPSLVVLDLAMPGTDGFEVARAIRARDDAEALPILICTGLGRDVVERARAAGGSLVCNKPVEPRHLVAAVRRLCPMPETGGS